MTNYVETEKMIYLIIKCLRHFKNFTLKKLTVCALLLKIRKKTENKLCRYQSQEIRQWSNYTQNCYIIAWERTILSSETL